MEVDPERTPWVEPELPAALAALPEQQRMVVVLLQCFEAGRSIQLVGIDWTKRSSALRPWAAITVWA